MRLYGFLLQIIALLAFFGIEPSSAMASSKHDAGIVVTPNTCPPEGCSGGGPLPGCVPGDTQACTISTTGCTGTQTCNSLRKWNACVLGSTSRRSCSTCGSGGTQACKGDGTYGYCQPQTAGFETCTNSNCDNNKDNILDNVGMIACSTPCGSGYATCLSDGGTTCSAGGDACTTACGTAGYRRCGSGSVMSLQVEQTTTTQTTADCVGYPDDVCDGVDNDCDGYIDNPKTMPQSYTIERTCATPNGCSIVGQQRCHSGAALN